MKTTPVAGTEKKGSAVQCNIGLFLDWVTQIEF